MNNPLLDHQRAFLLMQFLGADQRRLGKTEANKALKGDVKKKLELDARNANMLRESLAEEGYLARTRTGRAEAFQLTERGLALLLALEQYPTELPISGRAINALIQAVREQSQSWASLAGGERGRARQLLEEALDGVQGQLEVAAKQAFDGVQRHLGSAFHEARKQVTGPIGEAAPVNLAEELLAEVEELRREQFGHTGLVPIHVLRRRVAERFGPASARHDALDPLIKGLAKQQRLRLVPISDLRDATPEQLNDSVPGLNETLFYLEAVHAAAPAG